MVRNNVSGGKRWSLLPLILGGSLAIAAVTVLTVLTTMAAGEVSHAGVDSATDSIRLPATVQPTSQTVIWRVDPSQPDYSGSTRIDLTISESASSIRLHCEDIEITELHLTDESGQDLVVTWSTGGSNHELVVRRAQPVTTDPGSADPNSTDPNSAETPADPIDLDIAHPDLTSGNYTLSIEFANEFNVDAVGLYRTDFNGDGYAFTQFEVDDAREAFPCFDEPSFKIPFHIIVDVPTGQTVVSNTPIVSRTSLESWDRVEFALTKPLPTYLLMIAVGPLDSIELPGLGVPARIYAPRGQSHLAQLAAEMTPPLLHALEDYFGSPYPFAKLDLIAVPEYWPGAMEHPGAITFADRLLLQDPAQTSPRRRRGLATTLTHELAHQWFGDWVTMEWWNDLWLNESFADWMADKITDQVYPEFEVGVESEIDAQQILATDARVTTRPIRRPVTDTGNLLQGLGLAYNKGKAVLRMFENWMGPENFRLGVIDYLEANAWGNATADDLWAAIAQRSSPEAAEAFASFVEQAGFPLISVEVLDDGRVWLHQERFRNRGAESPDQLWHVPITLKYPMGDGFRERTILLTEREQMIQLEACPSWILPKGGGASYYRWTLSPERMQPLYNLSPSILDVRERIDLLANASGLFDSGRMTGDLYLDILAGFSEDPDPRVIRYLLARLQNVRDQFVTTETEEDFAVFVRRLLWPTWNRMGPEPREGESLSLTLLRPQLFLWLGRDGGDKSVRAAARSYVDLMTMGDDSSQVPASLREPAVRVAAATGDAELFARYATRFEQASDPGERSLFLDGLAFFDDPELFQQSLDLSLTHPSVRSNEILFVARRAGYPEAKLAAVHDWVEVNYEEISGRIPGIYVPRMPLLIRGCSLERMERALSFFSQSKHQVPGTMEQVGQLEERVRACLSLRDEEGVAVANYLAVAARVR